MDRWAHFEDELSEEQLIVYHNAMLIVHRHLCKDCLKINMVHSPVIDVCGTNMFHDLEPELVSKIIDAKNIMEKKGLTYYEDSLIKSIRAK